MFLKENCEGVYDIPASRDSPHAPYGFERQRWLVLHQKLAPTTGFVIKIRGPVTVKGTATPFILWALRVLRDAAKLPPIPLFLTYRFRMVYLPFSSSLPAVFDRSSKASKSPSKSPAETLSKSRLDLQVFCGFIPKIGSFYHDFKFFYYCISAIFYWGYLSFFCVPCWLWCKLIVDVLIICA